MEKVNYKIAKFDGEEYQYLSKIADEFLQKGETSEKPQLILILGGVAAGKSTLRKQKYDNGYVFVDAGAIYLRLTDNETKKVDRIEDYCQFVGNIILATAITKKKNIVVELIGDNKEHVDYIINGMSKHGYSVNIQGVFGDVMECYQRHLKQEREGRDDISSYHTQEGTISIFASYLN